MMDSDKHLRELALQEELESPSSTEYSQPSFNSTAINKLSRTSTLSNHSNRTTDSGLGSLRVHDSSDVEVDDEMKAMDTMVNDFTPANLNNIEKKLGSRYGTKRRTLRVQRARPFQTKKTKDGAMKAISKFKHFKLCFVFVIG